MKNIGLSRFAALDENDGVLRRVPNEKLPFEPNGIKERTHIESRLIVNPGETVVLISSKVIAKLFEAVRFDPADCAGLVLATCHTGFGKDGAMAVSKQCGISGMVYHVDRACSGFPAAIDIARRISVPEQKPVVVVTAEIMSDMINWEPPEGGMMGKKHDDSRARGKASKIFGDGAAVVLVKPPGYSADFEVLDEYVVDVNDPEGHLVLVPVEDSVDFDGNKRGGISYCINMPGKKGYDLLTLGPDLMVESIMESMRRAAERQLIPHGSWPSEIVPHQANGAMIARIREKLQECGLTSSIRVHNCIHGMGNISAASVPAAMAMIQDSIDPNALIAMPTVGAGSPGFRKNALTRGCVLAVKRG